MMYRFVVLEPHEIPQHDNMYALLAFVQNVDSAALPGQYHREFSADSVESMDEWIYAIQEAITACNSRANPLPPSGETISLKRKLSAHSTHNTAIGEMAKNVLEKANELTKPDTLMAAAAAGLNVDIANWLEALHLSCYGQQFNAMGYDNLATVIRCHN